jgi:hypothetical protein
VLVSEKPVSTKLQAVQNDDLMPVFDSLSPEDVGQDPLLGYEDDGFVVVRGRREDCGACRVILRFAFVTSAQTDDVVEYSSEEGDSPPLESQPPSRRLRRRGLHPRVVASLMQLSRYHGDDAGDEPAAKRARLVRRLAAVEAESDSETSTSEPSADAPSPLPYYRKRRHVAARQTTLSRDGSVLPPALPCLEQYRRRSATRELRTILPASAPASAPAVAQAWIPRRAQTEMPRVPPTTRRVRSTPPRHESNPEFDPISPAAPRAGWPASVMDSAGPGHKHVQDDGEAELDLAAFVRQPTVASLTRHDSLRSGASSGCNPPGPRPQKSLRLNRRSNSSTRGSVTGLDADTVAPGCPSNSSEGTLHASQPDSSAPPVGQPPEEEEEEAMIPPTPAVPVRSRFFANKLTLAST